jgi:6-phosphofructokinase 1
MLLLDPLFVLAYHQIECIGIYGYQGMIEGDFKEMGPRSVNNIVNKGGTVLKICSFFEFKTPGRQIKSNIRIQ